MIGGDYDYESSCDSIHVSSQPKTTDCEVCPEDIEFKLKMRINGKSVKPVYTLKKGVSLPYTPTISVSGCSGILFTLILYWVLILLI